MPEHSQGGYDNYEIEPELDYAQSARSGGFT